MTLPTNYQDVTTPTGALTEFPATTSRGLNAINTQVNANTLELAGTFNVKSYGADPGAADNTAAFQAAIDAAGDVGGTESYGEVFIPAGDYIIKSTITIKGNLIIRGAGERTFLDFTVPTTTDDNLFEWIGVSIDDFVLSDMRIRGPSTNAGDGTNVGIAVYLNGTGNVERFKARRLRIERFRYGLRITGNTVVEGPEVRECWFDECSYAGFSLINSRDAIIADNWVDCNRTGIGDGVAGRVGIWCTEKSTGVLGHVHLGVHGNHVYNAAAEGINIHAKYASITGNSVHDCVQTGIMFEPFLLTSPSDDDAKMCSTISGNTATGSSYNIAVRHDPVNNTRSAGRVAITGNVTSLGTNGIYLGQPGATTSGPTDINVSGNLCMFHTGAGVYIYDGQRISVSGNTITSTLNGVHIFNGSRISISGNNINGGDSGIAILGTARGVSITGGVVSGTNCGINMDATAKLVSVAGGSYTANPATANSDGIRIAGAFVTLTGVMVDNVNRSGVRISGTANNVIVNGIIGLDDQGTPTMDTTVQVTSSGANLFVDGQSISSGATVGKFASVKTLNGFGEESANAETPTAASFLPGNIINFIDSGDASGNGTYLLALNGTSWTKFALRDSNGNVQADNHISAITSTATAAGTTTLTINSTQTQVFTGSTTQTMLLPTTSVVAGQQYTVVNQSTGSVTVQSSGANTVATVLTNTLQLFVAQVSTPTTAAHWRAI